MTVRRLVLTCLAGTIAAPLIALSASRYPEPHNRDVAICEARHLADFVNAYWAAETDEGQDIGYPIDDPYIGEVFTDGLGRIGTDVDWDQKFVTYMRVSDGKPDRGPLTVSRLVLIGRDKRRPVYLIQFHRTRWVYMTDLDDPELDLSEYQDFENTWIMAFAGNRIDILRESNELGKLARDKPNLLDRKVDCAALFKKLDRY